MHCGFINTRASLGPLTPAADPIVEVCVLLMVVLAPTPLRELCQLGAELVGAVLRQEISHLLTGVGIGALEVFNEAGLGQG